MGAGVVVGGGLVGVGGGCCGGVLLWGVGALWGWRCAGELHFGGVVVCGGQGQYKTLIHCIFGISHNFYVFSKKLNNLKIYCN